MTKMELDRVAKCSSASMVRVLDFSGPTSQLHEVTDMDVRNSNTSPKRSLHRVQMCTSDDDPSDAEWQATWKVFVDLSASDISSSHSGSFCEMPLQQLGLYDEDEDRSRWSFAKIWADDQWQESELTLLGDRMTFTGESIVNGGLWFLILILVPLL